MRRWASTAACSASSPEVGAMFSRVPQPLAFAEALLAQFGALSRETDITALLGGFARAVGELSGCEPEPVVSARPDPYRAHPQRRMPGRPVAGAGAVEPAGGLHRRAVAAVRPVPEPRGQSRRPAVAAARDRLPAGRGAALAVPALRSAGEPGENGRGHGGLRYPAPTGPAGIRPSTGPAGLVRAGPAASAATPLATLRRAAGTVQRTGGQRLRADRQERGDA